MMLLLRRIHVAALLMLLLGTVFVIPAMAADADGDGVSDVEEIQELGTDPFAADISGVVADAQVRILSLPAEFTLIGDSMLVTGFAPRHAGKVEISLARDNEFYSVLLLERDERGVFSGVWDVSDVCASEGSGDYTILVEGQPRHLIHLGCNDGGFPMESLHFAGQALDPAQRYVLKSDDEAVFEAVGQPWLRLYSVYSSVVFSKDLYATEYGKMRVSPWKELPPGKHTLYVMPHDPIRRLVYEPLVIPFEVVSPLGENLKATVYYAPGAMLIIGVVFVGSIMYIRRLRGLRHGILRAGEAYPDELY